MSTYRAARIRGVVATVALTVLGVAAAIHHLADVAVRHG